MNLRRLVLAGLLLTGLSSPSGAHQGVNHGQAKHQKVAGIDVLLELHSLAHFKSRFGGNLQGSHVLSVRFLKQNRPMLNVQVKAKLIGPDKRVIGPAGGQALVALKDAGQHYVAAYRLTQKGKYPVMVMFRQGNKVSQAAFEVSVP